MDTSGQVPPANSHPPSRTKRMKRFTDSLSFPGFFKLRRVQTALISSLVFLLSCTTVPAQEKIEAPELEGGVAWLNTSKPIKLKALKGKIVILDFWTLCCINCIHTLPDLAKLEKKYPNELVVIGIHSPKFENEKETESIRKALLRYEVKHPVVNDANMKIWRTYGANSWPSLVLIDPEGYVVTARAGEGHYETFDRVIGQLIKVHKAKGTLDSKEFKLDLGKETSEEKLRFPGKVIADPASNRIFIADSTNHRIVVTDLNGKVLDTAGGNGPGLVDGDFSKAMFNDPQGMALQGDTLFVADRKNHSIRALDLKAKKVTRVAGTGSQGHDRESSGKATGVALNSPWDVLLHGKYLYIAMAGHHQIWRLDLSNQNLELYAGNGRETLRDGPLLGSSFAQPSGLTTDGTNLYVADSETSSIRKLPLNGSGDVSTIVGLDLFEFGDVDGKGEKVRLQHALGVAWLDGKLFVADTYNSKIKTLDPVARESKSFLPGFGEPGGISAAGGKLYVADTNNHRIMVIDPVAKTSTKLNITGLELPKP